jgi:glycerol-3-phosphate dehydrogenase
MFSVSHTQYFVALRKGESTSMADAVYDIFIAGGGINGCGIARDAVGRGYSVFLAEMKDLASGTSSRATKLIHGGLRYLEHYEFRLVRESLMEREVLWSMAPHIIWPLRFVLPLHKAMRPGWMIRLGLFLYDYIGGRKALPATRVLNLATDPAGKPLKPGFRKAFEYSDCWVNDARLVALNARDAADRGAVIKTRTKVVSARREGDVWNITTQDTDTGETANVRARLFVNAAGPWVDKVLQGAVGDNNHNVRLVQGSHIIIRKKFAGSRAYFFQNNDGRIFFAIPYEDDFTLIGTTDQDYKGDPANVVISDAEIDYLCAGASEYFAEPVTRADMVWSYSGVRPLYDDGASKAQEATRDYVLKAEGAAGEPQLLNIFGGKITTYRRLAEHMLEKIEDVLGKKGHPWTAGTTLPGGDFDKQGFDGLLSKFRSAYPFLSEAHARRLVRLYGTRAWTILDGAKSADDLGRVFGADLTEAEVAYLADNEWARGAEDVLWRRTKLGLRIDAAATAEIDAYLKSRPVAGVPIAAQ